MFYGLWFLKDPGTTLWKAESYLSLCTGTGTTEILIL